MQSLQYEKGDTFRLTYKKSATHNMSENHMHDSAEFFILLSGARKFLINDSFFEPPEGGMISIPPHTSHRTLDAGENHYTCLICNFSLDWLKNFTDDVQILSEFRQTVRIVKPSDADTAEIHRLTQKICSDLEMRPFAFEISVTQAVLKLLTLFLRHRNIAKEQTVQKESYARISELIRYIHKHFHEPLTLPNLAKQFYVSEYHLCRTFKEYTGQTVGEHIASVRIHHACKLLAETKEPVRNVSALCGFGSISGFNKCFRQLCGKTPLQYRKEKATSI